MAKFIDPAVKSAALSLVAQGRSYRETAELLAERGQVVSHESIRSWHRAASDAHEAPTLPPPALPVLPDPGALAVALAEAEALVGVLSGEDEAEGFKPDLASVWTALKPAVEELLASPKA